MKTKIEFKTPVEFKQDKSSCWTIELNESDIAELRQHSPIMFEDKFRGGKYLIIRVE
jgi:hypothetical protein